MKKEPAYPVGAVGNALRLLLLLTEHGELRVTEAADSLKVAPSTAHRLLAMLVHHGFATQDARRVYLPGPQLCRMTAAGDPPPDLVTAVRPRLEQLSRSLGETIHLIVLEGSGARFLDGVESSHRRRVGSRIGLLLPAHVTAGGKAQLAELPEDELHALYWRGVPGTNWASPVGYQTLRRELAAIRRRGYATNREESRQGISAVGTCIRDRAGRVVGSIAVASPTSRCPQLRLAELAEAIIPVAERIGQTL